jgi:ABC-type transport system substrate-binding protein
MRDGKTATGQSWTDRLRRLSVSVLAGTAAMTAASAHAAGVLTVAMTAGDIAVTTGTPDQGFEGFRFVGWSLYDALAGWDLSRSDVASDIIPGLATSWNIDPANPKRWIIHLREGVKFHDGCTFSADDVVWNFGRITDQKAPQFYTQQYAFNRGYTTNYAGIEKIDDKTVAITTNFVESLFPYTLSYIPMISRCRAEALKYDWAAYAAAPSGTGPYRYDRFVPHERLEFIPNKEYWNPKRVPKQDRMVLLPMPVAATRVAALLNGQVNFIEAPPPDAIPRLKSAGMNIIMVPYPHNWPFTLNFTRGPMTDLRVRQAANYAINRDDFVELLGGTATPEYATVPPNMPYYGHPVRYEYNPDKATALLKEAGCYPCKLTLAISTSGSGQMQPLPMNELLKSQMEAVGFQINFLVMDWNALIEVARSGVAKYPDIDGYNGSRALLDPVTALIKPAGRAYWSPAGSNWGHFYAEDTEQTIQAIFTEFDPVKRLALLTKLHEQENEHAIMIFVVHDLNPRALSPKVHGFVQAQNWFQDMTPITVDP